MCVVAFGAVFIASYWLAVKVSTLTVHPLSRYTAKLDIELTFFTFPVSSYLE